MRPPPRRHPLARSGARALGVAVGLSACAGEPQPPPGRTMDAPAVRELPPPSVGVAPSAVALVEADASRPGGGAKIASIAMRNWIYLQPDPDATKIGYLRAGAVVDRAAESAGDRGCDGGWYGVAPRGYVCVGKGASLDLTEPVVLVAGRGPRRDGGPPYRYVLSRDPPPHLYFKLPSEEEQEHAEGRHRAQSLALFGPLQSETLGPPDPLPELLAAGKPLPKPYGADRPLSYQSHRGRARKDSAFGLVASFEWTGRRMGLTTELDIIPLDRTKLATESSMKGVVVPGKGVPAIVASHGVFAYEKDTLGNLRRARKAPYRSGWVLTGVHNGSPKGLLETTDGSWLPYAALRVPELREDPAGFAADGRKWIDVSIRQQLLVAYEGTQPVFATLVSTGRGGMGDPETTNATVRGTFMVHAKHVSATMDGEEGTDESFDLHDVPFVQYFHKGYALHGAYWHDDFGRERSHGCVNLSPADAAWLFEWTDPQVPEGWHGALNPNAGTLVYIHR